MNVHDGHRDRLRELFTENGLNSFNDVNALELLLFYSIPRRDTNPIAHALLERFGSLAEVMRAPVQQLMEVPGIGEKSAQLISLIPQIMRKAAVSEVSDIKQISNTEDAGRYLVPRFVNEQEEVLLALYLDSKMRIICCRELSRGVVNSVSMSVRMVVETALKNRASSVIISHNHPDGFALPSKEDRELTRQLQTSLRLVEIDLLDHIVVADGEYVSLADSGFL